MLWLKSALLYKVLSWIVVEPVSGFPIDKTDISEINKSLEVGWWHLLPYIFLIWEGEISNWILLDGFNFGLTKKINPL